MPVIAGPTTPYVTPQVLLSAPTGISWSTIPQYKATVAQQQAEQFNICQRATSMVDTACNNVLRATIDTEQLYGPDFRITVNGYSGVARIELSRFPVTQVLGGQWSPAMTFPPSWQPIAANLFMVERPPIGIYGTSAPSASGDGGQAVMLAPGYITWFNGRNGNVIQVTYVNGWPHTSLTQASTSGASAIQVDDCTGWAPAAIGGQGATGIMYDGNNQETITCIGASAQSGPGVLALQSPTTYAHAPGVMVSTLPGQVIQAAILFSAAEALVRGATATTINTIGGGSEPSVAADHYSMQTLARELCLPYRRVI